MKNLSPHLAWLKRTMNQTQKHMISRKRKAKKGRRAALRIQPARAPVSTMCRTIGIGRERGAWHRGCAVRSTVKLSSSIGTMKAMSVFTIAVMMCDTIVRSWETTQSRRWLAAVARKLGRASRLSAHGPAGSES